MDAFLEHKHRREPPATRKTPSPAWSSCTSPPVTKIKGHLEVHLPPNSELPGHPVGAEAGGSLAQQSCGVLGAQGPQLGCSW